MFEFGVEFDSIKGRRLLICRPETGGTHASWRSYHVWGSTGDAYDLLGKTMLPLKGDYFCWLQNVGRETIIFQVAKKSYAVIQGLQERVGWRKYVFFFQRLFISFFGSFESTLEQPDVLLFRFGKLCSEATWRDGMNVWYSHGLV